jgi:hypothetical protein
MNTPKRDQSDAVSVALTDDELGRLLLAGMRGTPGGVDEQDCQRLSTGRRRRARSLLLALALQGQASLTVRGGEVLC